MTSIQTGIIALILGALIAGVSVWLIRGTEIELIESKHKTALAESQLAAQKANTELANYKLEFETNLGEKKNEIQSEFASTVDGINKSIADLRKFRLQDPYPNRGTGATDSTGGTSGSNGPGAGGSGVLSQQTSDFLYDFSGEADIILGRLRACKAWNAEVEGEYARYKASVDEMITELEKEGMIKKD